MDVLFMVDQALKCEVKIGSSWDTYSDKLSLINSRSQHDVSHPVSGTYSEYNRAYNPLRAKYYRTSKIFAVYVGMCYTVRNL